jgi:hypothetical protein
VVDFTGREAHYVDHLAPIWRALPPELRGRFFVPPHVAGHARARGVEVTEWANRIPPWGPGGPIVVAATADYRRALAAGRPIVLASHGAGQSYLVGDGRISRSYAGGPGREQAALFLATNEYQAARWRRAYPATPVEVIGCPKLEGRPPERGAREGPVCVSFHWDCQVAPESRTAWPHYREAVFELAREVELVAHAHPRIASLLRPQLEQHGIRFLADFEDVLDTAALYIADNTSTLFEFAALGGPVVVLNAPWFRRGVHHGLRFWEYADVGIQVDEPERLHAAVLEALRDPPEIAARRREVCRAVYPISDPARRAAAAIAELAERMADPRALEPSA